MPKGPQLNDISRIKFTTRDSLGIEGVATTLQGKICPIVNTVTPRAFYWPFMVWIYYDFYKYSGITERTSTNFSRYLKRQDYFFVLATLLTPNSDRNGLVGIQKSEQDILNNPNGPYPFNPNYFQNGFGGMMYYNAGCLSMLYITDQDDITGKQRQLPVLGKEGERMALAFESVIKDTDYYKYYRTKEDSPVPKNVLEEYGKVIKFNLDGFVECKKILKEFMFEDKRGVILSNRSNDLSICGEYLRYLYSANNNAVLDRKAYRRVLFDMEISKQNKVIIPDKYKDIAKKWEITIGRQYFTSGLEMIWKFMLEQLEKPMNLKEWIRNSLNNSLFSWDIDNKLSSIVGFCEFDFDSRESVINEAIRNSNQNRWVENGLKVILSIYNRFQAEVSNSDYGDFYNEGALSQSISLIDFFKDVDMYMEKSIREFLLHIMQRYMVEQHYITAFEKMLQGRDGFYYEMLDNLYVRKHRFDMRFQDIRLVSLLQVMKDIDMVS